jgi:uncharacterized protein (DUF1330 family)
MTKVYIVAMPKVTNQDVFFQEYASKVAETLGPFDGKFLAVNPNKLIVEGDEPSGSVCRVLWTCSRDDALSSYRSRRS